MKKIIIFSSIFILIDQLIKIIVRNSLMGIEKVIIPNFLYLTGVKNSGGAFSLFSGNSFLLISISFIVLIFIFRYLLNNKINGLEGITYSILVGGIVGNLIDRLVFNYVFDYIGLIFGSYYYPVFNLADIGIVIGIILIMYKEFIGDRNGNRSN